MAERKRTMFDPAGEEEFQGWYRDYVGKTGLNPNPDDSRHAYDYRGLFSAMKRDPERYTPRVDPKDGKYHGSSEFKDDDHPNRFVETEKGVLDTKHGRIVKGSLEEYLWREMEQEK